MTIETGRTTIRQLRATSSDRDPFAYQLRLGSMLASADVHPPGVPASAIICIRTLIAPPLPTQALRYGGGRPPLWWEERVRTLIKHALQEAYHPLYDTVPTNCETVIFADRAELLACLASDWCSAGDNSNRWWWQSLFRAGAIEQFLIPAWLETPEYIPAALLHLASARKATAFVGRLPIQAVRTLLHSITRSFALPELQTVFATAFSLQSFSTTFSPQPFSAAALLQEHEHVPATSETAKTTAPTAPTATINTWEIAGTARTIGTFAPADTTATSVTTNTSEASERSKTTAPTDISDPTDTTEVSETAGTTAPFATMDTTAPFATMDTTAPIDTSSPTGLPDSNVGADLACPSPHPVHTLSGGEVIQVITGNNRPAFLANPSSPTIVEQASKATPHAQAPWLPWVPESTEHNLSPEQQALLGVGLMLQRAPATVRTASFAQSIYHWYGTDQHTAPQYPAPTPTPTPTDLPTPQQSSAKENALQTKLTSADVSDVPVPSPGYPRMEPHPGDGKGPAMDTLCGRGAQIETAYGGIFYLINLALFLHLYGDFTTPLQPGIALPIWDFVALLGQQMLDRHIVADPVWPLLAQLTGRPVEEAPGRYFEPPEPNWRIPPAWLSAFPEEDAWHWSRENGRLRVLHPTQFLLLDIPLDTDNPTAQLRHELNSYANIYTQGMPPLHYEPASLLTDATLLPCGRVAVDNLDDTLPPSLQRWLHWLMPYVYARLQRALGLAETEDPSSKLCSHEASIALTATHMHINFALAELPIEIRIAGLDRDPGWVPAAGRFIAFHFH